ncbi:hypothetical protein N7G274_005683 [Stereocaulon virgatum]|uniref:Uncharacterized protein n=1 Tax=Stereocaulon virgatum TaxID=373712 RepID=A0ABR4A8S4_9LECA
MVNMITTYSSPEYDGFIHLKRPTWQLHPSPSRQHNYCHYKLFSRHGLKLYSRIHQSWRLASHQLCRAVEPVRMVVKVIQILGHKVFAIEPDVSKPIETAVMLENLSSTMATSSPLNAFSRLAQSSLQPRNRDN